MPSSREIDAAHRKQTGMEGTQELADAQRCISSPQYATHCRFGTAAKPARESDNRWLSSHMLKAQK